MQVLNLNKNHDAMRAVFHNPCSFVTGRYNNHIVSQRFMQTLLSCVETCVVSLTYDL